MQHPNSEPALSERAAARFLGVNATTMRALPIPRIELLREDKPNAKGIARPRRFIRYAQADLDAFKRDHITIPGGWVVDHVKQGGVANQLRMS